MNIPFSPKIAAPVLRSLVNYGERRGLNRNDLISVASVSEAQLNDGRLLVDVARYEAVYQYLEEALESTTVGFEFGQHFEADRWGVLGYLAITAPNLMGAMAVQYRFQSLSGNMGSPIQIEKDGQLILQWVPAYSCSHHMPEQILTGLVSLARRLTNNGDFSPDQVFFTHKSLSQRSQYESYFGCPVTFSQDFNGLFIDKAMLGAPLRRSDAELHHVLLEHAKNLLTQQTFSSPLEVIKDYILKTLPDHVPDIEEVSDYLNLSVRSTQRKLQEYSTSYSDVLDSIRKELALTYLKQTQNSVLYVSERLGFSEQSAFQRAFKRWTGTTPRRYRLSLSAEF